VRLFSYGGHGLALAALALVVFGAYDSYPPKALSIYQTTEHYESFIDLAKYISRIEKKSRFDTDFSLSRKTGIRTTNPKWAFFQCVSFAVH